MLPPIDPLFLDRNPGFKTLYQDLTTRKLNPDGSTRDAKKERNHDKIRKSLQSARTEAAERQIVLENLTDLPFRSVNLPEELHEVIELISAQLHGHLDDPKDQQVLKDDIDYFLENPFTKITPISLALSAHLSTLTSHVSTIAKPSIIHFLDPNAFPPETFSEPPELHTLPARAQAFREAAETILPAEVAAARFEIANSAAEVLRLHRELLETVIRILEQTMHGSVARATRARAELLSVRATGLELEARIHRETHPPEPELVSALTNYSNHLGSLETALENREAQATKALELYGRAGGKVMLEIGARKEHILKEMDRIREEIARLEGKK